MGLTGVGLMKNIGQEQLGRKAKNRAAGGATATAQVKLASQNALEMFDDARNIDGAGNDRVQNPMASPFAKGDGTMDKSVFENAVPEGAESGDQWLDNEPDWNFDGSPGGALFDNTPLQGLVGIIVLVATLYLLRPVLTLLANATGGN
jgi:hypothetical protein